MDKPSFWFFFILLGLSRSYDEYSQLWAPGYLFRIIVLMFPITNSPELQFQALNHDALVLFRLKTGLGGQKNSILIMCLLLC